MLALFTLVLLYLTSTWIQGSTEYYTRIMYKRTLRSDRSIAERVTTIGELAAQSAVFFDKSLLIKEVVESPAKFLVLSFPQKWCKSINLDMMRKFLEIEDTTKNISLNRKLFLENEAIYYEKKKPVIGYLKKSFLITENKTFMKKHFGKYPVVYVNFTNLVAKEFKDDIKLTLKRLKATISRTYRKFPKVYAALREKIQFLNGTEKEKAEETYKKFRDFYLNERSDIHKIRMSIRFLIKVLSDHFRKKVYVMLDEYDSPVIDMYAKPDYTNPEHEDVVSVYKMLIHSTFVNNNRIKKAIISGRYNLKEFDLTNEEKDVEWHSLLHSSLAPYYAFTHDDVDTMALAINIDGPALVEGYSWYADWVIPPHYNTSFYHPGILADFLNSGGMLGGTWFGGDVYDEVINLMEYRPIFDVVLKLINEDEVLMKLDSIRLSSKDLAHIQRLLYTVKDFRGKKKKKRDEEDEEEETEEADVDVYLGFAFMNGFVTLHGDHLPLAENATHAVVRVPNLHIKMKYSKHATLSLEERCLESFQPMEQARRHFQEYMMTRTRKRCQTQFETSMHNLMKESPQKCRHGSSNERLEHFVDYARRLMEILALEILQLQEWKIKVYTKNRLKAEFVIFDPATRHAVVTDIAFNERNAEGALRRAKSRADVLKRFGPLATSKFIGINFLFKCKRVNLSSAYVQNEVVTTPLKGEFDEEVMDYEMNEGGKKIDPKEAIPMATRYDLSDKDFLYAEKLMKENVFDIKSNKLDDVQWFD